MEFKKEKKDIWKNIKGLDSEIRTAETEQDEDKSIYWIVEIGLFESLGETAGDILTEFFADYPTEIEIKERVINHLIQFKEDLNGEIALSDRHERQLKVLKELR